MTIENKELYNLFKSMFKACKTDNMSYGLFLEGFDGGITAYVTDGYAVYRKTFYGDNKYEFVNYYDSWTRKDGVIVIVVQHYDDYDSGRYGRIVNETRGLFEKERFNSVTVDGKEFKKAVKGVDAINKGDKTHDIILSVHDGKFDLASWNDLGSAAWQLDGGYTGNGAACVNKKYLDGVKSDKPFELSYSDNGMALHIRGEIDAVIMRKEVDAAKFMEVLEYEYHAPEKPVNETELKPVETELKPAMTEKPKTAKPAREKIDPAVLGWKGWTWNPKKLVWTKACNW